MKAHRLSALVFGSAVSVVLGGLAGVASAKSEVKGAAILDTACGKVAVKQMGLVHQGKMDEANMLTTKEMQEQWTKMGIDRADESPEQFAAWLAKESDKWAAIIRANNIKAE